MSDTDAVERRVQALLELGRVDDAIQELTPAVASDPSNAALLVMLSEALLRAGRPAEAERGSTRRDRAGAAVAELVPRARACAERPR